MAVLNGVAGGAAQLGDDAAVIGANFNGNAEHINGGNERPLGDLAAHMNIGGELHKANGGRAHGVAAIIGGTWCYRSGSGRSPARSGWRRCGGNGSVEVFGAHAHDGTVALDLNFAETGLVQSLNEHGNERVDQVAESFRVVWHQLRPRTIALDLIEPLVIEAGRHLVAANAEDGTNRANETLLRWSCLVERAVGAIAGVAGIKQRV